MATTRMTREQIAKSVTPERRAEFQRRVDTTTDADIQRQMIEDGDDPNADIADADIISPAHIRKRLGMTQEAFANATGVPIGTLRNWEQNRVPMEPAAVALFRILARDPKAALRALGRQAA
ncbi:MAG: helix-turn-helix domain-containing protein [Rhodospirillales bacterium]